MRDPLDLVDEILETVAPALLNLAKCGKKLRLVASLPGPCQHVGRRMFDDPSRHLRRRHGSQSASSAVDLGVVAAGTGYAGCGFASACRAVNVLHRTAFTPGGRSKSNWVILYRNRNDASKVRMVL